uniref:Death domain-containing membrane protein NRADD n=1 Tax=Nannospalax galili TaxID=1026970 RepID=A0A8C6W3M7_NANGA
MLHNSSHSKCVVYAALRGQDRDIEVWVGIGEALAPNTSSLFPPDWRSHKQRQQLAKARTVELGDLDKNQRHGVNSIFVDSPRGLEPCIPSQGPYPDIGCQLYLHILQQQQEEVERLLMLGEPDKGWQGLAGHLGYQAKAVETMACGQMPAYTLLRDWAAQEGSRATLRVLEDALSAMGREDVLQVLGPPAVV